MNLDHALPGHLVASVLEVLLIDAGYAVIPTGVERTIRELRTAPVDAYIDLVPPQLRAAPDFFVLDLDQRHGVLTEIKFRQYLHTALCGDLRTIQRAWAPFTVILAVAEPPKEWTGVVRCIKVFTIEPETQLDKEFLLTRGARLQDVFGRLGQRWGERTIVKAQEAILRIAARD